MIDGALTPVGVVESDDEDQLPHHPVLHHHKPAVQITRADGRKQTANSSTANNAEVLDDEICSLDLKLVEDAVEEMGPEPFHDAIASSFAKTERMLAESHEKALKMIKMCMNEVKLKEKSNQDLQKQVELLQKGVRHNSQTQTRSGSKTKTLQTPMPSQFRSGSRSNTAQSQRSWLGRPARDDSKPSWSTTMLSNKIAEFRSRSWVSRSSPQDPGAHSPQPDLPGGVSEGDDEADSSDDGEPVAPTISKNASGSIKVPAGNAPPLMKLPSKLEESAREDSSSSSAVNSRAISPLQEVRGQSRENSLAESDAGARTRRPSIASCNSKNQEKLELLPQWAKIPKQKKNKKKLGGLNRGMTSDSLASCGSMVSSEFEESWFSCTRLVLDPNATPRATWDITSIVLVVWDMVMIPLQLFDLPDNSFTNFMVWTTRLFWTADIFMSFSTGVLKRDGQIEYRFSRIAWNYMKTWFLIDFLIVAVDWIEVLWSEGSFMGFARAGKASRTFRIIRMIRLLRLARVRNILHALFERIESEQLSILAGIASIMVVIVGLSHIIACIWYGIATEGRPDTWLKVHNFDTASIEYQYTTALHWSLLQFAGGTDEIVPQNTGERIYAVVVFILAFVLASIFVGRLTSSMTQLHMLSKKDTEKFQVLKRYLSKHEISSALTLRVIHNAQHALSETQRFIEESKVELLGLISDPLRVELHYELYAPVLRVHPFFNHFCDSCPQVMKKICHGAMSQLLVSAGDVVFMPGEVPSPPQMFIVCSGELSYHTMSGAISYVEVGHWISEATLWTPWIHQGMLKVSSDCRLCRLDATKFLEFTARFDPDFDIRKYARAFVTAMNNGEMDLSDLPYHDDIEEIQEVLASLEKPPDPFAVAPIETAVEQTAGSPGSAWRRFSGFSGGSNASEDTTGTPSPLERKKSVLMVTPTETEKKRFYFF